MDFFRVKVTISHAENVIYGATYQDASMMDDGMVNNIMIYKVDSRSDIAFTTVVTTVLHPIRNEHEHD